MSLQAQDAVPEQEKLNTDLRIAAEVDNIDLVEDLLRAKASVNSRAQYGFSALHNAVMSGHIDSVRILLRAKADVNSKHSLGKTALHNAAYDGYLPVVEELVQAKADLNSKGGYESATAHDYARERGHQQVADFLRKAGKGYESDDVSFSKIDEERHEALRDAFCDDLEKIKTMLDERAQRKEEEAQLSSFCGGGEDPQLNRNLRLAAQDGKLDRIKNLLWNKAEVNAANRYGLSALHMASANGRLEVCQELLCCNAAVNSKKCYGYTALHLASMNGQLEVLQELAKMKALLSSTDDRGRTALHWARYQTHQACLDFLCKTTDI